MAEILTNFCLHVFNKHLADSLLGKSNPVRISAPIRHNLR